MLVHPQFNPIALDLSKIGLPIAIHWYGLTYLVGFALFLFLAVRRSRLPQYAATGWTRRDVEDLLFYGVMGTVIGGRLGYVLFYKPGYYAANPLEVFAVWKGGMAFHGGLLGVMTALALFAYTRKRAFLEVSDLVAPCVPTGFAAGRIGNFINGELWGASPAPTCPGEWCSAIESPLPRHPRSSTSSRSRPAAVRRALDLRQKPRGLGQVSGAFLAGYGILRFIAEFFREPDNFLGLLALGMSMGQWLCVPMIVAGIALWAWGRGRAPGDATGLPLAPRRA
jgi:phosphatidylglycerol:prolipoprotein diacylglycerol transferase